jgi:triacylglycerol lipase
MLIPEGMGVAISRKAVLGGQCIETLEHLGKPLTNLIDTYIGLGGVGYGLESCSLHEATWPSCNTINGMSCNSKFLVGFYCRKV